MQMEYISPLVALVADEVRQRFEGEGSGHDWAHIARVVRNALYIAGCEGADQEITALGALLHDIADHKFHNHSLEEGPRQAAALLHSMGGSEATIAAVVAIVAETSYKGAGEATPVSSMESAAVQDADRLDAMGAIGIARAFAYGGSKGRPLYSPEQAPEMHASFDRYARSEGHTINHFYEKLLLLKDRMQTDTGRLLAAERHLFMEQYLKQFYKEWNWS